CAIGCRVRPQIYSQFTLQYWNQTTYGLQLPLERIESSIILAIVFQYLCPVYISILEIGVISAGVMSSADLLLLAASSVFAHNVYRKIIRKKASAREVIWGMLITICFIGAISVLLAILVDAAFVLYFLSGELIYSILFPQLVCVLFIPNTNAYVYSVKRFEVSRRHDKALYQMQGLLFIIIISFENRTFMHLLKLLPTRLNVFNITVKPQEVESPQRKKLLCVISQTLTGTHCFKGMNHLQSVIDLLTSQFFV
uniref:Uncharacterized protein n=1 Tax=Callorhinchus milii TaxID=7868 RepID=A0A4W3IYV5_CALMI